MNTLEQWIESKTNELTKPEDFLLDLFLRKFSQWGVTLSDTQISELRLQLRRDTTESISIHTTRAQEELIKKAGHDPNNIKLDLNEVEKKGIEHDIVGKLLDDFKNEIDSKSDLFIFEWKKQQNKRLNQEHHKRQQFISQYVDKVWGEPLKLLELLLYLCEDTVFQFNKENRSKTVKDNNFLYVVLIQSYLRACQVGYEIMTLLANGCADGAYARWRTLHEISVIALFIGQHGNPLAERYLNHSVCSDYVRAKDYQKYSPALGYEPLPKADFEALQSDYDIAKNRFNGDFDFRSQYGWAEGYVKKQKPKDRITLTHIEGAVGLDYMKVFRGVANLNVHAGADGILFRFGAPRFERAIPTRGSFFGLSEPGRNTALSLCLITVTLTTIARSDLNLLAITFAINRLKQDIFSAFDEVDKALENEIRNK